MVILLLFVFGAALIAGPIVAGAVGVQLGTASSVLMTGVGLVLAVVAGIALVITQLYVKTKASEAFVKTGMGGMTVIMDGGALIIPVVHEVVAVSLETLRLEVNRVGTDALITSDKLRADIKAEFFVRVNPTEESVKAAARSLGGKMGNHEAVKGLVEDKLVSALRTAAATRTLEELNTKRDSFVKEVTDMVKPDLEHNGLMLEVVTISRLDQTDPKQLRADNIFDAQGLRTIAEVTQKQETLRNQLVREGEQARKAQDVATVQKVLELQRTQAEAEATQRAQVQIVQADKDREAQEKQIAAKRAVELAELEKGKALEVAAEERQSAQLVAEQRKQQATAEAEALRAVADAGRAEAEAKAEGARQEIVTVQVKAEAEREGQKSVIAARAEAERGLVTVQKAADGVAYRMEKEADGQKAAAGAEAEAITKRADAEASAAEARARGAKAEQMVPVEVQRELVGVEKQRVDVLSQELQARTEHGAAAQNFEIAKLRITKEADVRIAAAQATAQLTGKIEAQVFGTPEDVARMTNAWMKGMTAAGTVDGFMEQVSPETLEMARAFGAGGVEMVKAVAARLGVKPDEVAARVAEILAKKTIEDADGAGNNT